jgi:predicted DNA-binding antitoxin AbrB/MazE fold protein
MSHTIEAIYEDGIFKPLGPVELREGAHVRLKVEPTADEVEREIRQHLLAEGADPAQIEQILENMRLLWRSYDTLTDEQKAALDSMLDRSRGFD